MSIDSTTLQGSIQRLFPELDANEVLAGRSQSPIPLPFSPLSRPLATAVLDLSPLVV
jgi:hypothetical protein